jgi:hypothetical protein
MIPLNNFLKHKETEVLFFKEVSPSVLPYICYISCSP